MAWKVLISDNATVQDTVNWIRKVVNVDSSSQFVKNVVAWLKKRYPDPESFIRGLFKMIDEEIIYTRDPEGHEIVMTSKRFFEVRRGDCKKFSTFIAAVLKAAGFKPVLKVVSYDGEYWAHIYVILPVPGKKYITLDPVNKHQFNKEVSYKKATVHFLNGKDMKLSVLGAPPVEDNLASAMDSMYGWEKQKNLDTIYGVTDTLFGEMSDMIGCPNMKGLDDLSGLSADTERAMMSLLGLAADDPLAGEMLYGPDYIDGLGKKKRKGKLWGFLKKVGLAPSRASFLLIVRTNLFGIARKMAKALAANKTGVLKLWKKLGGNVKKLRKAIDKGKNFLKKKSKRLKGIEGLAGDELFGELEALGFPPAIAAAVAAATPIVVGIIKALKKDGAVDPNNPEDKELIQNVDQQEKAVEQKIDSGHADQFVQTIQQQQAATPAAAYDNSVESTEAEDTGSSDEGEGDLSGLGALDLNSIISSVTSVLRSPTVTNSVSAINQIRSAAKKAKTKPAQQFLNNQANTATTALKMTVTKGLDPTKKKAAAAQLSTVFQNVNAQALQSLQASKVTKGQQMNWLLPAAAAAAAFFILKK